MHFMGDQEMWLSRPSILCRRDVLDHCRCVLFEIHEDFGGVYQRIVSDPGEGHLLGDGRSQQIGLSERLHDSRRVCSEVSRETFFGDFASHCGRHVPFEQAGRFLSAAPAHVD